MPERGAAGSGRADSPLPAMPPATRRASGSPPPFGPRTSCSWTPGCRTTGHAARDGGFDATVEYVEFLGSFARVELDCAGERLLMDLSIAGAQHFGVTEGSTVRAAVPREAVRIYAGAPPDA